MADPRYIEIVRNEDRVLTLIFEDSEGDRFDITNASEIVAKFAKDDDTTLEKKLSLGEISLISGPSGKIEVTMPKADTLIMKAGNRQDFEVVITMPAGDRIVQFGNALTVREQKFPS